MSSFSRPIFVLNGRVPGPRAHSITTVRTASALVGLGVRPEVWVPRRTGRTENEPSEASEVRWWYGLEHDVPLRHLACIDAVDLLPAVFQPVTARLLSKTFARSLAHALRRVEPERPIVVRDAASFVALARAGLPFVAEVHELPRREPTRTRTLAALLHARGIVTLTREARTLLDERGGTSGLPGRVIPCGCPAAFLELDTSREEARAALGLPTAARVVAYTGSLQRWKGAERIRRLAQHFRDVRFHVVGGLPRDRRLFASGLPDNVVMRGFLPPSHVAREILAADACLVTLDPQDERARSFTSPLKLVETLALGRSVLAPDLPSVRELVRHGESAWLHAAGSEEDMILGLRGLLEDAGRRESLARRGRERARSLTYDERARAWIAFLSEVW